jgi:sulfotransferase family protein
MIGQHPDLFGLPELKLFCFPTLWELAASLPRSARERGIVHRSPGLVRAVAQLHFGDQSPRSLSAARQWLAERPHWPGEAVFDLLQAEVDPRRAVEKSPENVDSAGALARLATAYPRACYLHLTRHPATTQQSMYDHWCRTMGPVPGLATACTELWLEVHERIVSFTRTIPPDRQLRMRAEDVLNDPLVHLMAIARWLGLAADEAAIEAMGHPERSPFAAFGPVGSGVTGGNDAAFLANPIPRSVELPPDVDPRPGWAGDLSHWPLVVARAAEFGYRVR